MVDWKPRYQVLWSIGSRREKLVYSTLLLYLPPSFQVKATGVGTMCKEMLPNYHSSVYDKFDFTIFHEGKPVCYLEVTGYYTHARKPAIMVHKLRDGLRYNVLHVLWFAYVRDNSADVRFISAVKLLKLYSEGVAYLTKLRKDEKPAIALPSKHWDYLSTFLNWLTSTALKPQKPIIPEKILKVVKNGF